MFIFASKVALGAFNVCFNLFHLKYWFILKSNFNMYKLFYQVKVPLRNFFQDKPVVCRTIFKAYNKEP